jgi:hypothetical protein
MNMDPVSAASARNVFAHASCRVWTRDAFWYHLDDGFPDFVAFRARRWLTLYPPGSTEKHASPCVPEWNEAQLTLIKKEGHRIDN